MTDQRPSTELALGMFFTVFAAAVVAAIFYVRTDPNLHLDLESFVVFAPIYAAAQAIERLLEPFAAILLPAQTEKEDADAAKAGKQRAQGALEASFQANPGAAAQGVAVVAAQDELAEADAQQRDAAARLSKRQSERALVFFAIASVASLALCAVLGLGIIQAMTEDPLEEYLRAIDVALTGIVIGAGTKPLHDLISRVEKAKEKAAA